MVPGGLVNEPGGQYEDHRLIQDTAVQKSWTQFWHSTGFSYLFCFFRSLYGIKCGIGGIPESRLYPPLAIMLGRVNAFMTGLPG